jgi:hypothetical protein
MFHSPWRIFVGLLPCVLLFAACKPKPGDKCSGGGLPLCADPASGLICENGVVTVLPCRGVKGCSTSGSTVACDNSLALVDDACDQPNDVACSVDHKSALECQNAKFALAETCKGARGCAVDGDKISCDNDVADLGDPCQVEGDYACTSDKLMALKCTAHKFDALNTCRGKDACKVIELPEEKKTNFVCDDSIAQENDACDTPGEEACSLDKTEIFTCKANHFAKDRACPGGCSFDEKGERFTCVLVTPVGVAKPAPAGGTATPIKPAIKVSAPSKPVKAAAKAAH